MADFSNFDSSDVREESKENTFDLFADVDFDLGLNFPGEKVEPQEDPIDFLGGVDFGENTGLDLDFEARLAEDYPVQKESAPTSLTPPEAPSLPELECEANDAIHLQQQQFVDPRVLYNDLQPAYTSPTLMDVGALNFDPPLRQEQSDMLLAQSLDEILSHDPIFLPQPFGPQLYSDSLPIGNQINGQYIEYQQPIAAQINGPPMLHQQPVDVNYQWPIMNELINDPILQSLPSVMLQPEIETTLPSILPPMPQPIPPLMTQPVLPLMPQPVPPLMPQPTAPGMPAITQQSPHPVPTRPVPIEPLPEGAYKPVDPAADSYVTAEFLRARTSRELPSAGTQTTSPPIKRPTKNHNGELLLNDRIPRKTHRDKGPGLVEPEKYYGPSPSRPRDWGPRDKRGNYLFTYTEKGELSAGLFLTAKEMRMYLLGPSKKDDTSNFDGPFRLPGVKLRTKKKRQGLTLWLGWPAAMSNVRYPRGGESTKCRFKNCPYRQNTITLGDPWVILDERQNMDGEFIDPFHNAGYVHLFCLESNFDLVDLWQCLDIRPDYRSFKRESHPYFNLAYKLSGVDNVVKGWWSDAYSDWVVARSHGMKRIRTHESSLSQRLVDFKLESEPKNQAKHREKRRGADIAKHRGDPEVKQRLVEFRRHGLLDEKGWPVPGADQLLQEMRSQKPRKKGNRGDPTTVPQSPESLPVYDYGQLSHQPVQLGGIEPAGVTQPVYQAGPASPIANPAHGLNRQIPAVPYASQVPDAAAEVTERKRTFDEAILEDALASEMPDQAAYGPATKIERDMPSPKRQRLDASPVRY